MIKCIGICSKCGKCKNASLMSKANERKTKMLIYPEDFHAETGKKGYGIAFDIGTTTVVGMLCDLEKGIQLASIAETNPQSEFGMDVITRITYCGKDIEKVDILRNKIVDCLNSIIEKLCASKEIHVGLIKKAVVCGNTTMSHLFAGYLPLKLALAPFAPEYTGTLELSAEEAGLIMDKKGKVILLPNIAGHVGGDITSGILATRLMRKELLTVFIDIGTNGEIVITDGTNKYACSTAAGSAFEGASILHGMRAASGAIEKIIIEDGHVFFSTIGECEPEGICGSGIIDGIAQMIKAGLINRGGKLISVEEAISKGLPYVDRLIEYGSVNSFKIATKTDGTDIIITQKDIRELQLAKGAIAAGIELMLREIGKTAADISEVIVAGAFGTYIDKDSAMIIGLLPKIETERITLAGNTAGAGVSMALMSEFELEQAKKIPEEVKHIELADKEGFSDIYMMSLGF